MRRRSRVALPALLLTLACGSEQAPASKPCDEECQDAVALRALRETMKLAYNLTLQAKPVGMQDETTPCPGGGSARLFGEASSNAERGATEVTLTYELTACSYLNRDDEPDETYDTTISGTVSQSGVLAAQPTATTALVMASDRITLIGTVYDPPLEYSADGCAVELGQSGSQLSGTICGREAGIDL